VKGTGRLLLYINISYLDRILFRAEQQIIISKKNEARKPFKCTQPDPVLFSVCIHTGVPKKAQGIGKKPKMNHLGS
jgi:hypothetical protein